MSANLTQAQLQKASEHFHYEVRMMEYCVGSMNEHLGLLRYPESALLESFLIHARVIWDFLYTTRTQRPNAKKAWDNDVIAEDFFASPLGWYPKRNEEVDAMCKKIHKHVAHLSMERIFSPEQWYCIILYNGLVGPINEFIQKASPDTLSKDCTAIKLDLLPPPFGAVNTSSSFPLTHGIDFEFSADHNQLLFSVAKKDSFSSPIHCGVTD